MSNKHGDLQFFHDFENKKTYALEVNFNKQDLLELLNEPFDSVNFMLGVSKVHPNDRYSKAVGREISKQKLKSTKFYFLSSECFLLNSMNIIFYCEEENMSIKFRIADDSDKPHFLEVDTHSSF